MFSFICAWINGWVNTREAGDLRRHRIHYDVIVMFFGWQQRIIMMSRENSIRALSQYKDRLSQVWGFTCQRQDGRETILSITWGIAILVRWYLYIEMAPGHGYLTEFYQISTMKRHFRDNRMWSHVRNLNQCTEGFFQWDYWIFCSVTVTYKLDAYYEQSSVQLFVFNMSNLPTQMANRKWCTRTNDTQLRNRRMVHKKKKIHNYEIGVVTNVAWSTLY